MKVCKAPVAERFSVYPQHLHVGSPKIDEGDDTLVTEIVDLVNVEFLEAEAALPDVDEAGRVEVAAVEEVEVGELLEAAEDGGEGEGGAALAGGGALHLVAVSVTVQTACVGKC